MEVYPVRDALGFPELLWSVRHWLIGRRSGSWVRVPAIVESYELLLARENGWIVIFYSYDFDGKQFSGEWRKWLRFSLSSQEAEIGKVIKRFPRGAAITVRVDPRNPSRSVAVQ